VTKIISFTTVINGLKHGVARSVIHRGSLRKMILWNACFESAIIALTPKFEAAKLLQSYAECTWEELDSEKLRE
jgi:hypothetical protein